MFDSIWDDNDKLTDVTEDVIEMISTVYQENAPELVYFMTLYNIFNEFLEDISEDVLPNEATGFKDSVIWNKLFHFQKDAALAIINKLEQFNGCILADSVGLGKTFTALAVIKYYEGRNKNVLVLCPKKLSENWMTYRGNLINNPLAADRLRYDILYHTDLSRDSGSTVIGLPIDRINWGNYDLVVIDESHNFRNGTGAGTHKLGDDKENRYMRLMNRVIKPGVKTKVLMLSATPVNNRFYDLRNQLALAYEGESETFSEKLKTKSDIDTIFRQAQTVYNAWCKLPEEQRTTATLLSQLDFDFFEVLDSVTIARSRKHIQAYYNVSDIGTFPERNKPISLRPKLTNKTNAINYKEVYELLSNLQLTIYTPTIYIQPSKIFKYLDEDETENFRKGRELGIQRLMKINLLKRMESSVHSFLLTVRRIYDFLYDTSEVIDQYMKTGSGSLDEMRDLSGTSDDFDFDDQNTDFFSVGKKVKIDLRDMDYIRWKRDIDNDIENLQLLILMVEDITPEYDFKLNELLQVIREKVAHPINPGNKKILIFTAFADTAEYLYENVSQMALSELGLHTALVTGSVDGQTTIPKFKADIKNDYIDEDDRVTDKYRADLANGVLAPLPESCTEISEGVHALVQSIYDEHALDDMISNGHDTKIQENALNDNFYKKEFQTLWNYINHQYAYTVEFDSEELIGKAIAHLDEKMFVAKLQYTVTSGTQGQELNADTLKSGAGFSTDKSKTYTLERAAGSSVTYDLIGEVAEGAKLTRRSAAKILTGIKPTTYAYYRNNPEEFISKAIRLILEQKATMIVDHISYNQTDGTYDSAIFTAEKNSDFSKAFHAKKHIQDYVFTDGYAKDGQSIERQFAEAMDVADEVCVYAKLPKGFSIPTPVGNYSPDWAIAFHKGTVKHIFFIAETKGTMESLNLKPIEQAKIKCAKRLFAMLSKEDVVYHEVDSYHHLLNIMEKL